MAIKKSELYSSLWAMCDELRGGMDASQYKDYVLVILFIKYISDKYAGKPFAPITVPPGASFKDMVAFKGNPEIGDFINKKVIQKIEEANPSLGNISVDFNNEEKLGSGDEMVKRLSNLIAIFQKPELDFSKNKAEGDDILGDAYEYLMRNFATESGKSKGQFYTPAEVSRVIAKIIGINSANTTAQTTVYDPTCGSGSLLLKVADEANSVVSIYGQEKDVSTAALSRMNMVLHNYASALIKCNGNSTLSNPLFTNEKTGGLKTFDYVVANPPFSYKAWSTGVDAVKDPYGRFQGYGVPPAKNGDYAFLLHILASLKATGKGAVVMPHGVLFRGNAEADIRKNLVKRGYIRGIIGLPANLFYGTGIPACIIVLDKEHADKRKGIFMIDASKGYVKDGNKNRLQQKDIHKIVDAYNNASDIKGYSRMVSVQEIAENDYNLNIPRYIDSLETEDIQDIDAHLNGGIPDADITVLQPYWEVYPSLKDQLFSPHKRKGYSQLKIAKDEIRNTVYNHPEFAVYADKVHKVFTAWRQKQIPVCKAIDDKVHPKQFIHELSEDLLSTFSKLPLLNKYDVYQHLMTYWLEQDMQDDVYVLVSDGWKAGREVYRIVVEKKGKNENDKPKEVEVKGIAGIESKLLKPKYIIDRYFAKEQELIDQLHAEAEEYKAKQTELDEEHAGEDGLLAEVRNEKGSITAKAIKDRVKEIAEDADAAEELKLLQQLQQLAELESSTKKKITAKEKELEKLVWNKYPKLLDQEIQMLVVEDKWMKTLEEDINGEMERVSHRLANRIKELAERYDTTLPALTHTVTGLEEKVNTHLQKMGYTWS